MANEQLLSQFSVPHINGTAAAMVLANEILEGIAQGEIEKDGRGTTEKYTKDLKGAQVRVVKIKPLKNGARQLGAAINGGNFNANNEFPESEEFGIDVLNIIDAPIDIADVTLEMLPVDVLGANMKNWNNLLNRNINASAIACKLMNAFGSDGQLVEYIDGTDKILAKFLDANIKLDEGDEAHDIDIFPTEGRIMVIKSAYRGKLLADSIGSAWAGVYNPSAQRMMANGTLSPDAVARKIEDGYIGEFDGIPCHVAAPLLFKLAEKYMGLPAGELDDVCGYIASDVANARGIDLSSQVIVIQNPNGQGVRLLPKVRFGVACFYPKGNAVVVKSTYTNPITKLADAYSSYAMKLIPAESRQSATVAWASNVATVTAGTGSTVAKIKGIIVGDTTKVALTVKGFYGATTVTTGGAPVDVTSGSAFTTTTAGTYYKYVLVILADGTCFVSKDADTYTVTE